MRVEVVINKRSGMPMSGAEPIDEARIRRAFAEAGVEASVHLVKSRDFEEAIRLAARRRPDAVVAGGGDGSISTAGRVLAAEKVPMGILPLGSFNYLARHLSLPFDIPSAVRIIAGGRTATIDAVEVNGLTFLIYSSIGIFPRFIRERVMLQKRRGWTKLPAMAWAFAKSIISMPILTIELTEENCPPRQVRTPFFLAGNSLYSLSPLILGGDLPSLMDGVFSLYLCRRTSRIELLWMAIKALFGRIDLQSDFELHHLTSCSIDSRRNRRRLVAVDGELVLIRSPLRYRILPKALTVIVPEV